jgi:type IV pilus assembly protein PilF
MMANRCRLPGLALAALLLLAGCASTEETSSFSEESPGDLYVRIAAEYYRLGEVEPALKNAQKAIELDADNAQAHNVIATIYQRIQQNALAEQHFRTALRLAPEDSYTLTAWGNFLCEQGKYAEADAQFKKALANPLFNAPWLAETRAAVCARRAGQSDKAEQHLRRALTANPRYDSALYEMADLDYSRGRYKSARGYLERYFKIRGYSPRSLLLGVRIERAGGSRKRARSYERALRERFPDSPEVLTL